jgi:signal transduction histidine kinase
VLLTDITAFKEIQSSLEQARDAANEASRTKSDFLARMSHELRTPLNSIIGFSHQVLRRPSGALHDRDRLYLERVHHNGTHLLTLINRVLDLSKIESGHMHVHLALSDVGTLVRDTVALLEGEPRSRDVSLYAVVPDNLVPTVTDAMQLRQVLINLIGNAIKFTRKGLVAVRVEIDALDRPVAISVRDTGIGIPAERLEAIFEAFEQATETTGRDYGGTGLGLSISRSICTLIGARLEVCSEEGVGSTFRIVLPRLD